MSQIVAAEAGIASMQVRVRRFTCRSVPTEEMQTVTPTNDRKSADKSAERYTAVMVGAVVIAASILLAAGLLRLADRRAAQTGDIIVFPATRAPSAGTTSFAARRAITDTMSCTLDVQTMQKSGGSLVVETSRFAPGLIFQVHWAGERTSSDRDDCGRSADLLLNSNQISALIFAAGGTGVAAHN